MLSNLSVLITVIYFLYYYFTRTFNYWKLKDVRGPKPIPLFGNYIDVALRWKAKGLLFNEIYKQYPDEKVVGFYQMTSPTLLIRDLDIVKQIMIKDFEIFPDRATYFSKEGLGENIFHSDFDTWKVLRNKFSPVFTTGKIKATFPLLVNSSDNYVYDIETITREQPEQDVYQLVMKYTLATSLIALFDWNIESLTKDTRWCKIFDENLNSSHMSDIDLVHPGFMTKFNLTVLSEKVRCYCHQILKICTHIHKVTTKNNNFNVKHVILNLKKETNIKMKRKDQEDILVQITDNLLAGQIWVFYTAGYLNNAVTLTYALYHLARNPDVQEKLRKEIDEVIETHGDKLTYDALKNMKYLEMVFKETLRINPMTHGLVRSVTQDIKLDGTSLTISKGSTVIVSPYAIHHDEKYYPEPEKFWPERFSTENIKDSHPCTFLSFGIGRRSCLGSQFARIQFGICVVKLLQRFKIETSRNTCSSITFDRYHMLMKPEIKIQLKFITK